MSLCDLKVAPRAIQGLGDATPLDSMELRVLVTFDLYMRIVNCIYTMNLAGRKFWPRAVYCSDGGGGCVSSSFTAGAM